MRTVHVVRAFLGCALFGVATATAAWAANPGLGLVVCAPGYPGTTESAQPTMDGLAGAVAAAAGWKPDALAAEYQPTLDGGLRRLAEDDAALTLVSLPFYLTYREPLGLDALLAVTPASGKPERLTLVARRGAVTGPGSLEGWQVHGMHGYAPRFLRDVWPADWGRLPAQAEIRFTARIVASLRQAAAGEHVAVVLDEAQADALGQLPFADALETVTRSAPFVASVLCSVGGRLSPEAAAALIPALTGLGGSDDGRAVLESIRMQRFGAVDASELRRFEAAFASAADGS